MINPVADCWHISQLFHITPAANLASIRKFGLVSMSTAASMDIVPSEFASNEYSRSLDRLHSLDGFVYLCLHPGYKMFWSAEEQRECGPLSLLEIDRSILTKSLAVFSDRSSNGQGVKQVRMDIGDPNADHVNWMTTNNPNYLRTAEILIPGHIPYEFITKETPWQRDQYSFRSDTLHFGNP